MICLLKSSIDFLPSFTIFAFSLFCIFIYSLYFLIKWSYVFYKFPFLLKKLVFYLHLLNNNLIDYNYNPLGYSTEVAAMIIDIRKLSWDVFKFDVLNLAYRIDKNLTDSKTLTLTEWECMLFFVIQRQLLFFFYKWLYGVNIDNLTNEWSELYPDLEK